MKNIMSQAISSRWALAALFSVLPSVLLNNSNGHAQPNFRPNSFPADLADVDVVSPKELYESLEKQLRTGRPLQTKLFKTGDINAPSYKMGVAGLQVSSNGSSDLANLLPLMNGTERITDLIATQQFGVPRTYGDLAVYDLVGRNQLEPNIYHLELVFDAQKKVTRYRIRGFGITDAKFYNVVVKK
ncbi:MAG: hypothetical protein JST89_18005 [Cyanobacteria bacterium SZAS-4]|nr:hypothetical protein [Cyanobacteria bacterium SZAS-4]